jgi:hypothetical protein
MVQTGIYTIVLLPGAEEAALVRRLAELGDGSGVAQLTRVTSGFEARSLRHRGDLPVYLWLLTVRLVTAVDYDFGQNVARLAEALNGVGVVVGLETYAEPVPTEPIAV